MFPELTELLDKINLDPKVQVKYVDTPNQFADILTNGPFTRDERKRRLQLIKMVDASL